MSKGDWIVVVFVILTIVGFAFVGVSEWGQPRATITKIDGDGTVWIQLYNMPTSTTIYLYHDDIEEGMRLEVAK